MRKLILKAFLVSIFILGLTVSAYAQPVLNPVNGHYYEIVNVTSSPLDWFQARDAAAARKFLGMQGYLATITSSSEQYFIVNDVILITYTWLGGSQLDDQASPSAGWYWITGEPWNFTNWLAGQPNDNDDVENNEQNCLDMYPADGPWEDYVCTNTNPYYLVEYETDNCVGDVCYVPCDPMSAGCPDSFCYIYVPSPIGLITVGQIHYLGTDVRCVAGECPPGCTVFVPVQ